MIDESHYHNYAPIWRGLQVKSLPIPMGRFWAFHCGAGRDIL